MERAEFLHMVEKYIERDPECAPFVAQHAAIGLKNALSEAYERAADFEVVACVLAARRYPKRMELIKSKVEKWKGRTALNWDQFTEVD